MNIDKESRGPDLFTGTEAEVQFTFRPALAPLRVVWVIIPKTSADAVEQELERITRSHGQLRPDPKAAVITANDAEVQLTIRPTWEKVRVLWAVVPRAAAQVIEEELLRLAGSEGTLKLHTEESRISGPLRPPLPH